MFSRILLLYSALVAAQSLSAQVVQLPSMHTFAVETSVMVPDSGGAYLGGMNRSSHWMNGRGSGWGPLGRNCGRAGGTSAGGMMVRATIIDNDELDRLVLDEARAIREEKGISLPTDAGPRVVAPKTTSATSIAAIKRELAAEDAAAEADARGDFDKAAAYEKAGEVNLAKNYYRVAASKSKGETKQKALARLATLARKLSKSQTLKRRNSAKSADKVGQIYSRTPPDGSDLESID